MAWTYQLRKLVCDIRQADAVIKLVYGDQTPGGEQLLGALSILISCRSVAKAMGVCGVCWVRPADPAQFYTPMKEAYKAPLSLHSDVKIRITGTTFPVGDPCGQRIWRSDKSGRPACAYEWLVFEQGRGKPLPYSAWVLLLGRGDHLREDALVTENVRANLRPAAKLRDGEDV
jgi:hypothetical protein